MTERRTHAYAVRSPDMGRPYHIAPRSSSRFLARFGLGALVLAFLLGAGAAVAADTITVEVVGEIAGSEAEVRETLLDLDGFGRWFPNTKEWSVLDRTNDGALVHGRLSLPWPLDDRDYVVEYTWSEPEAPFVLSARASADRGPEPAEGVVRVDTMETTWELVPLGERTGVRYEYVGSAGGFLPDWVFQIGWEMQTGILIDALDEEVERRRRERGAAPGVAAEAEARP